MYISIARVVASFLSLSTLAQASNVIDLTPSNFDSLVGQGKPALVEFFAPWCGHCKNLAPIYEELADAFSYTKDVIIAKVDADAEKALGSKYGVKGFPTLKWFDKNGELEDYQGGRQLNDLIEFVTKKSGVKSKIKPPTPPATLQLDYLTHEEIISDPTKDVLVAYTASWCGHCKAMKPDLELVAKNFKPERNVIIAIYETDNDRNRALATKMGIMSYPTIKFYPKGSDKTPVAYTQGRSEEEFMDWLNEKCGTYRAPGGGLNEEAGRIEELDDLAHQFFTSVPTSRKEVYDAAVKVSQAARGQGAIYLRVMEKVLNGTSDYFVTESARLASILEKRKLSQEKLDQIQIKANILASFAAEEAEVLAEQASQAGGAVKEAVEEKVKAAAEGVESGAKRVKEEL